MSRLFNGSDEYLQTSSAVVSAVPLTIAGWVYFTGSVFVSGTVLCVADTSATDHLFSLRVTGNGSVINVRGLTRGGGYAEAISAGAVTANAWQHVAFISSATNAREALVMGGGSGTNATSATPLNLDASSIGRQCDNSPGDYFPGRLAEIGVWNVALTTAEVGILAAGYSPLFVRPQSLIAYYPLIRDEDQDRVGGYDMTAFNAPAIAVQAPVRYPAHQMIGMPASIAPTVNLILTTYGGYSVPVG